MTARRGAGRAQLHSIENVYYFMVLRRSSAPPLSPHHLSPRTSPSSIVRTLKYIYALSERKRRAEYGGGRGVAPARHVRHEHPGNLYHAVSHEDKLAVVRKIVESLPAGGVMFDSAGKYGAGLALEELGQCLKEIGVDPSAVIISNKLAWKRAPLLTDEPTFEPGAWVGLKNDATQDISYQGILDCYEEGNALLGEFNARVVSVHDPDEYLAAAVDDADLEKRRSDVLGAYRALQELKEAGEVDSIGVGAKDITAIDWISDHVALDWAMFACSITVKSHNVTARNLLKSWQTRGSLSSTRPSSTVDSSSGVSF